VTHGREYTFDDIGGAEIFPMLGRKVIEDQQRLAVLCETLDRLLIFDAPGSTKPSKAASASFLVSAIQISWSGRLALGCWLFGSYSAHWRSCAPSSAGHAFLATLLREPLEAQRPVSDRNLGADHKAAALQIKEELPPRLDWPEHFTASRFCSSSMSPTPILMPR
jgi:hypothetical protein